MEEIAAAIPDDLATLRPEDIRVEAEFVDLVVATSENSTTIAPVPEDPRPERLAGDPAGLEAYFAQTSQPIEFPAVVPAMVPPVIQAASPPVVPAVVPPAAPAEPRSVSPPVDAAIGAVLPSINIETPSLLPRGRQLQPVSEVILQPATVLAWSLLVLLALPMAFLAGLLLGHFVWK